MSDDKIKDPTVAEDLGILGAVYSGTGTAFQGQVNLSIPQDQIQDYRADYGPGITSHKKESHITKDYLRNKVTTRMEKITEKMLKAYDDTSESRCGKYLDKEGIEKFLKDLTKELLMMIDEVEEN